MDFDDHVQSQMVKMQSLVKKTDGWWAETSSQAISYSILNISTFPFGKTKSLKKVYRSSLCHLMSYH